MATQAMEYRGHGGQCCGYYHIYWMGIGPNQNNAIGGRGDVTDTRSKAERLDEILLAHENHYRQGLTGVAAQRARPGGERFVEVILTEDQLRDRGFGSWREALETRGFVEVANARNVNTSNRIYVFLRYATDTATRIAYKAGPVTVVSPVAPPPPPPPEVTDLLTEFYAIRRNGMKYGPYISDLAARGAHGNLRNFQRRTIRSDGSAQWDDV